MYGVLFGMELGFSLLMLIVAWIAGSKASRLLQSGSAERLHRKARKLMFCAGYLTLPGIAVLVSIGWMTAAMPSLFWEDRVLLNAPFIAAPLLAVWFVAVPKLWRLWRETQRRSGTLDQDMRARAADAGVVMPFRASALSAAASLYFALVSPVPFDPLQVAPPIFIYLLAMAGLWVMYDRRWRRIAHSDAAFNHRPWQQALRSLGILGLAVFLGGGVIYADTHTIGRDSVNHAE